MEAVKKNYAQYLDQSWKEWVIKNLNSGVPVPQIATILLENGFLEASIALLESFKIAPNVPLIDLSANTVQLADKTVQIVFTCQKPYVVVIDDFLSASECDLLIDSADNKFFAAGVVDNATGQSIQHADRTSMNASFARGENEIVRLIERRVAELVNWPVEHGEPIQILRYKDGGQYKAHFDYFDADTVGGQKNMERGGQRVGTFLMYLSEVDAGGATRFPTMNFEVRPKKGMALLFINTLLTGAINPLTLHASVPVTKGVKYIATKWLREKPYV